MIVFYRSFLLQ